MVSLTGFSLVGGPAYNDAQRRRGDPRAAWTCPTSPCTPVEFQTLQSSGAAPSAA
ncbi:MAG: hypothetical protein MZW92_69925 [Comamonadaceae bacterium]|nr:hypothetical protein [Comamonadaceae bacterium]